MKAAAQGVLSYFGTYTVNEADKSFTMQIERSSFPNQVGTIQANRTNCRRRAESQQIRVGWRVGKPIWYGSAPSRS